MIQVTFQPKDGSRIVVEVADGREEAVQTRALERIFPGPIDHREAESEKRYLAVMIERAARARKAA